MERKILKEILLKYYKNSSTNAMLNGTRIPSYNMAYILDKEHSVAFEAWHDIGAFLISKEVR